MKKDIKFYLVLATSMVVLLMMSFYQISLLEIEDSKNQILIAMMAVLICGIVRLNGSLLLQDKRTKC